MLLNLLIYLFLAFSASAKTTAEIINEANLNYCTKAVNSGNYRSAGDQISCHNHFDMAPAYLIKCLRFENQGYPTQLDGKACWLYLYDLEDTGPWEHYSIPTDLEKTFQIYLIFKK